MIPAPFQAPLYAFIDIGKKEIIPVLIKKLNTEGNKFMAEVYLNCGDDELKKAGVGMGLKRCPRAAARLRLAGGNSKSKITMDLGW